MPVEQRIVVKMHIKSVGAGAVQIARQRSKRALEVRRATRRVVPGIADLVAIGRVETQRIAVTIKRSIQGHARIDPVVQGALNDVGVFCIPGCREHAPVPHHVADGGAAFSVSGEIRQFVRLAERFAVAARSNSAGHVHLMTDQVSPENVQSLPVR